MTAPRRYVLRSRIGSGAHGEVFLAEQHSAGGFRRRVALKVLRDDVDPHGDTARRMRDEARLLGRLHHPAIVAATDLVRLDRGWGVVLEWVPGRDVRWVTSKLHGRRQAFPVPAAGPPPDVPAASAVAQALAVPPEDSETALMPGSTRESAPRPAPVAAQVTAPPASPVQRILGTIWRIFGRDPG